MTNKLDEVTAKILQEVGYKAPVPPVVEEMGFFDIQYYIDDPELDIGGYRACYQQIWDRDLNGDPYDLLDMDFVYGDTVMEVISELMIVLGRPIKSDEWELGYDERTDKTDD